MKKSIIFNLLAVAVLALTNISEAQVEFDWATIGNAGNARDTTFSSSVGAVESEYRIATTEVTNTQYAQFLNAAAVSDPLELYSDRMSTAGSIVRSGQSGSFSYAVGNGFENMPVGNVTWYDAARFTNWLHNGQATDGSGTESGAYTLVGLSPIPTNAETIVRSAEANFFLPNRDEWYKAAYHDSSAGTNGVYFRYANGSDIAPVAAFPIDDASGANFNNVIGTTTEVGAYTDNVSPYGLYDLNGNVAEWTELLIDSNVVNRGIAGGDFLFGDAQLRSTTSVAVSATLEGERIGFRVAATPALKGDVDLSGMVDFRDIPAFIAILQGGGFQAEADCDCSGAVDFLDIVAFIAILQGG